MNAKSQELDFHALFDSAPDLYLILDAQFTIIGVNKAYAQATMVKKEDILGHGIFEIFPDNPKDPYATGTKNLRASLERVLKNKVADTMAVQKYDIRRPEGGFEERYWSPINIPVLGKNNEVQYIIHRVADVTEFVYLKKLTAEEKKASEELSHHAEEVEIEVYERAQEIQEVNKQLRAVNEELANAASFRQKMEEELRKKEQFLRSILESIPDMVFMKEASELRFVLFNKAGEELLGYKKEDLLGKNDYDLFPKEQADFFTSKDRETLSKNILLDIPEEIINTKNKGQRILHTKKVPLKDNKGNPAFLLGISEDITDFKKSQDEIKRLNEKLKEQVADLDAANKGLESFSYSVSHDLRAPLRHIAGFSEILLKNKSLKLDEEAKEYLAIIVEATIRMGKLIDDILEFSRVGRYEINKAPQDVNLLIQDVIKELEPDLKNRNIQWEIEKISPLYADEDLLRMVIMNLLTNAIKFTRPTENPLIEIKPIPNLNKEAGFFVKDNGVGFDMTHSDKLFGVFQRLHSEKEFEGSGIGLANIKKIVQRHGGRVWAEGDIGKGATFYIVFPKQADNK